MQLSYTAKAKKAIDIAGRMSKSLQHNYIGTEHILIGLLKENTGVAAKVLNENGVELDKILGLIKELIAPTETVQVAERGKYSPRAEKVFAGALREANRFHADAIGTEHLLLALLKEADCVASRLLNTMAVKIQKVYVDTLIAMGEDPNLYKEDLQAVLPLHLSSDDSILFAENYIRNWIEDILLFEKAEDNVRDSEKIKALVESYHRALVMHAYQEELIKQQLEEEITQMEILDYYNKMAASMIFEDRI